MNPKKIGAALFFALACCLCLVRPAPAAEKLNVVASTTFLEDMVKKIGGAHVETKHVASPKYNVHFIQPRPSAVRNVRNADLYVFQGLDLEGWSDPLVEAAGKPEKFRGADRSLDVSPGIPLLEIPEGQLSRAAGDIHAFGNPHYIMNPQNASIVARHIAAKLSALDPAHAAEYEQNRRAFDEKLTAKIAEWKSECAHCPGKLIVSYHKDIEYFADFFGLEIAGYIEPKPGIPPTPKHLAGLEKIMKTRAVKTIILPSYFQRGEAEALAKPTGAKIAVIVQSVGELPGTDDVFALFDTNVKTIAEAIKS